MTQEMTTLLDPTLITKAKLLLLIGIANGIPIFTNKALGKSWNRPLDGGARFCDGRRFFGHSKTLRGILLTLALTPLIALLFSFTLWDGFVIGLFAMVGDLTSSFAKRRLGLTSSSQALGLDQVPESLFPLIAVQARFHLSVMDIALMVFLFFVAELLISRVLYRLRLRDQPY